MLILGGIAHSGELLYGAVTVGGKGGNSSGHGGGAHFGQFADGNMRLGVESNYTKQNASEDPGAVRSCNHSGCGSPFLGNRSLAEYARI